jgi:hypothetical protein
MRLAGVDHIHAGTVLRNFEGDPNSVQGFHNELHYDAAPFGTRGLFRDGPATWPLVLRRRVPPGGSTSIAGPPYIVRMQKKVARNGAC